VRQNIDIKNWNNSKVVVMTSSVYV